MRQLILLFIFVFFYLFRFNFIQSPKIPEGAQIRLIARVSSQPYLSGSKQVIRLGQFLVFTQPIPEYFYGQKLEVIGKVQKRLINRFQTNFVLNYPAIRIIEEDKSLNIQTKIIGGLLAFVGGWKTFFPAFYPSLKRVCFPGLF